MGSKFDDLQERITQIGLEHHAATLIENTRRNVPCIHRSIRDIARNDGPVLVISAGPSLYRQSVLARLHGAKRYATIVATDGAYIQCLKAGIVPEWVVTIDPHPTRIVRWFGDPDYERNSEGDDYFKRQDLDPSFRENDRAQNAANIELVDRRPVPLVIGTSAPRNVVARTSQFERYWFAPLVDDPDAPGITQALIAATGCPALNTGGTVGTAAWAFSSQVLRGADIAVVGMDFGYPPGTDLKHTQEWNLTGGDPDLYPPMGDKGWFTSPTYYWYRQNMLDLLDAADATITNCSEGGLLDGERVKRMKLEEWLASSS